MATLTHAMLEDLHIGNASISLLAYTSGGVDITAGVDFSAADQIFTLEGSFNMTSDDPSSSDVKIDQKQEVIDTKITKEANWRMTGNIPSQAEALLNYFYQAGATISAGTAADKTGVKGPDGSYYIGKGFLSTPETKEVIMLVESESRNTAILFAHVRLIVSPMRRDDNDNPAYFPFVGYILSNPYQKNSEYVGDFAVLKAATEPTGA